MFNLANFKIGKLLYDTDHLWIGNILHEYGEYSPDEVKLMDSVIEPGFHIIEGGANIGCLTIPMARKAGSSGKVAAFEAQPQTAAILSANVVMNGLVEVVDVNKSFLGNVVYDGVSVNIPLYQIGDPRNVGGITGLPKKSHGTVNVNVEEIDHMVYVFDWRRLDLIKLDIEGNELSALRGAYQSIRHYKPIIYVENNIYDIPPDNNNPEGRKSDPQGLIDYLGSLGYICFWHTPAIHEGSGVISHNMICYHKEDERIPK